MIKQIIMLFSVSFLFFSCLTGSKVDAWEKNIKEKEERVLQQQKEDVDRIKHLIDDNLIVQLEDYMLVVDSMQNRLDERVQFLVRQNTSAKRIERFKKRNRKKIDDFKEKKSTINQLIKEEFTKNHPSSKICFEENTTYQNCLSFSTATECSFREKKTSYEVIVENTGEEGGGTSTETKYEYEVHLILKNIERDYSMAISHKKATKKENAYRLTINDFLNKLEIHQKYFKDNHSNKVEGK